MKSKFVFALRIVVALILIQTLRFKFTAHPDSVYIFEQVGLEPVGRIGNEVRNDGGVLFITAIASFVLATVLLYIYWKQIPLFGDKLKI